MHEENGQQEKRQIATLEELHKALYREKRKSFNDDYYYDDDDADCHFD